MKCTIDLQNIKDVMRIGKVKQVAINASKYIEVKAISFLGKEKVLQISKRIENEPIEGNGEVIINSKIVNLLNSKEIKIKDEFIESGNRKLEIDQEQYNQIEEIEDIGELIEVLRIPFEEFKEATDIVKYVSPIDHRPSLTTVCLDKNNLVALDGYRMGIRILSVESDDQVLIPHYAIESLRKVKTKNKNSDIIVSINKSYIRFYIENEGVTILCDRRNDKFVNYNSLIPPEFKTRVTVDAKILKKIAVEYDKAGFQHIHINFTEDKAFIKGKIMEFKVEDNIDVDMEGNDLTIAFQSRYIHEALKNYSGNVVLKFNNNVSPAIVTQGNKIDLILPIRLSI